MVAQMVACSAFPANYTEHAKICQRETERLAWLADHQPSPIHSWRLAPNILEDEVFRAHDDMVDHYYRLPGKERLSQRAIILYNKVVEYCRYGTGLCFVQISKLVDVLNEDVAKYDPDPRFPWTDNILTKARRELIRKKYVYPFYRLDCHDNVCVILALYGQDRDGGPYDKLLSYNKQAMNRYGFRKFDMKNCEGWVPPGRRPPIASGDGTQRFTSVAVTKIVKPRTAFSGKSRSTFHQTNAGRNQLSSPLRARGGLTIVDHKSPSLTEDCSYLDVVPDEKTELDRCRETERAGAEPIGANTPLQAASFLSCEEIPSATPTGDQFLDQDLGQSNPEPDQEVLREVLKHLGGMTDTLYAMGRDDIPNYGPRKAHPGETCHDWTLPLPDIAPLPQKASTRPPMQPDEPQMQGLENIEHIGELNLSSDDLQDLERQFDAIAVSNTHVRRNAWYTIAMHRKGKMRCAKSYLYRAVVENWAERAPHLAQPPQMEWKEKSES